MTDIGLVHGPRTPIADGVADYCVRLSEALVARGHRVTVTTLDWQHIGRLRTLYNLLSHKPGHPPDWMILQHTHLSWSRRGFPLYAVLTTLALKRKAARVGVIIHDPVPFEGTRLRDAARRRTQVLIMRWLARVCDVTVVTVPLKVLPWLRGSSGQIAYVPVGSNVPLVADHAAGAAGLFEVAVFGINMAHPEELRDIARVAQLLAGAIGRFRLSILGRGSREGASALSRVFRERLPIDLEATGVLPEADLARRLARSDALLFVRSAGVSSRRGTAVAAFAVGLPVVGYAGPETAAPVTDGGVMLMPPGDVEGAARALAQLARDPETADTLKQRSLTVYRQHFAWSAIAESLERALFVGPAPS